MKLRDATLADRQFFFDLRNDPDVVKFSTTRRGVTWAEHCAWWEKTEDHLLVAEEGGRRIGQVRLSPVDDACCELHYALVAADRGRGWGAKLLEEGRRVAKVLGYQRLLAHVDSPNTASIRAFLRDGWGVNSGLILLERDV